MRTPDGSFMVCYAPDLDWTKDQFQAMCAINNWAVDPETLDFILKEGMKREPVIR